MIAKTSRTNPIIISGKYCFLLYFKEWIVNFGNDPLCFRGPHFITQQLLITIPCFDLILL